MSSGPMGDGGGGGAVSISSNTSRPFATVPSTDEANHALSSVQQLVESSPSMLQQPGDSQDFSDAFRFLRTETSVVQRIVLSLTCDKSVWEAVMNNEAVRELKDLLIQAARSYFGLAPRRTILGRDAESSDGSIPLLYFLERFFVKMKAIAIVVAEKTIDMASNLFQSVKSSLLLSVLVILVIVVDRVSLLESTE
ncbi:hypothetical protein Tco_0755528 [Tanacetum coccineum]